MVLEALEKILDINFKPDIDIRNITLINIEGGDKLQKDGPALHVNLDELDGQERRELVQLTQDEFEEQNRVLQEDRYEEAGALENADTGEMDEVLDYFDQILIDRYLDIIEASLHLRILIDQQDLRKKEIQDKKRDLVSRYGPEAMYLSSLATAGYFDPNAGLRDLYVKMGLNDKYDKYNFQKELERLISDELLCVFVENDETIYEVKQEVRGRLARYQRKDPINDWLDIRGIGSGCEEIIDGVVDELENEFTGIDYDRWNDGDNVVVRIHPHTLPPIA